MNKTWMNKTWWRVKSLKILKYLSRISNITESTHDEWNACKHKIKGKSYQMKCLEKIHWWSKQVDRWPNEKVYD
jgi:hypothetical protein